MEIIIYGNRRQENLSIEYRRLDIDILTERTNNLGDNPDFQILPYFIRPVSSAIGEITTDIIVMIKAIEIDEIIAILNGVVVANKIGGEIQEDKDLWLLITDGLELIQQQIEERRTLNKNGNLLIIPNTPGASDPLKGWIRFDR